MDNSKTSSDEFITRMLDDTYSSLEADLAREKVSTVPDLAQYFENRKKERHEKADGHFFSVLEEMGITHFKGIFLPQTGCYRFFIAEMEIDIPKNWAIFEKIHILRQDKSDFMFILQGKESGGLGIVLSPFMKYESDIVCVQHDGVIGLALLPAKDYLLVSNILEELDLPKEKKRVA